MYVPVSLPRAVTVLVQRWNNHFWSGRLPPVSVPLPIPFSRRIWEKNGEMPKNTEKETYDQEWKRDSVTVVMRWINEFGRGKELS
jgi:hypothetical protein